MAARFSDLASQLHSAAGLAPKAVPSIAFEGPGRASHDSAMRGAASSATSAASALSEEAAQLTRDAARLDREQRDWDRRKVEEEHRRALAEQHSRDRAAAAKGRR